MRAVARYSAIFLPSISISNSATRAHFMPRTVFAASATAFSAALAKLYLEDPTTSMTFCAMCASPGSKYSGTWQGNCALGCFEEVVSLLDRSATITAQ